ncbi:MAG TPA: ribose-5-phosphate isomerase RpiA, partial [Flavisolibacter sp.]|nr:ribose-5-phosphate isomerase RpiA [Flavisolibacter sp.]
MKKLAGEKAAEFVRDKMVIGLGTGSTAYWATQAIGKRVSEGLQIGAVATSVDTEAMARELGIPILSFSDVQSIDLTIDGADEVDPHFNLIKGGGGALMREKLVAFNSRQYIVVVDESKMVQQLGIFPLPVEILPFGWELTLMQLKKICSHAQLRQKDGQLFTTDNGNLIADLTCLAITNPEQLNEDLHRIPGVLET